VVEAEDNVDDLVVDFAPVDQRRLVGKNERDRSGPKCLGVTTRSKERPNRPARFGVPSQRPPWHRHAIGPRVLRIPIGIVRSEAELFAVKEHRHARQRREKDVGEEEPRGPALRQRERREARMIVRREKADRVDVRVATAEQVDPRQLRESLFGRRMGVAHELGDRLVKAEVRRRVHDARLPPPPRVLGDDFAEDDAVGDKLAEAAAHSSPEIDRNLGRHVEAEAADLSLRPEGHAVEDERLDLRVRLIEQRGLGAFAVVNELPRFPEEPRRPT